MQTHYVFVDYDNTHLGNIGPISKSSCKIIIKIFLDSHHNVIPLSLARALQPLGDDAEYIQLENGRLIAPVAFHLRHIARSLDRLLSYAEGKQLSPEQLNVLRTESAPDADRASVFAELEAALAAAAARVRAFVPSEIEKARLVGKKQLPTTVGGLLVHVADHTQRHVGQAITTAKIVQWQQRSKA